jgi:DNA recombination-dependent growth factor C
MAGLARELESGRCTVVVPDAAGTMSLNADAATFLARLQLMNQEGIELLQTLDRAALTLASDVVSTANRITIHIEAGKIIDQLVVELEDLAARVHDDTDLVGEAKILDLISRNYTMQSERRVHAEVRQSGAAVAESVGQDRTGLGVNVELF